MTFDEMFIEDGNVKLEKIIEALFPILPDQATPQLLQEIINGKQLHISSTCYSTTNWWLISC